MSGWNLATVRMVLLGVVAAAGLVSIAVTAPTAQQGEMVVEVERLQENLYVLRGGGGNSSAFITSDGVVLIDTKVAGWGQPLIDRIAELTDNPVTTIIDTHAHFDHVSGNVDAQTTTARLMDEWNRVTGIPRDFPDVFETSGGQGLPTQTFDDRLTLGSGDDQMDLYYFGRGHTGGDTWVVLPALRVMHAGDMFPGKQVPIMDASNGGSGVDYAQTLRNAYDAVTDIDQIITGHSTQMTRDDLGQMAQFVEAFVSAIRASKEAGQSVQQAAEAWSVPSEFEGFNSPPAERLQAYVQVIYDELD